MRIYELSKQINISNKEIITMLAELDINVKCHLSSIGEDTANKLIDIFNEKASKISDVSEKLDDEVIDLDPIEHSAAKKLPFASVPSPKVRSFYKPVLHNVIICLSLLFYLLSAILVVKALLIPIKNTDDHKFSQRSKLDMVDRRFVSEKHIDP